MDRQFPGLEASFAAVPKPGNVIMAGPAQALPAPQILADIPASPPWPAGTSLGTEPGRTGLTVLEPLWLAPGPEGGPALRGLSLLADGEADGLSGEVSLKAWKKGYSLAWIILSDKGSAGLREDRCGPVITEMAASAMDVCLTRGFVIPDETSDLKALLARLALEARYDLILTSGGTGLAPRDITPEATLPLLEKRLPGFERAMTNASLAATPHGAISRAVAGTLGQSLIINMPGSPKAVRETLEAVLPAAPHAIDKLQGDPSDCAR